jgi:hypothetical protein
MSSAIPAEYRTDESAICNCTGIGVKALKFNRSNITLRQDQDPVEVLCLDRVVDSWTAQILFLLRKLLTYSCATLLISIDHFHGRQQLLVANDVLEIESISWYLHHIQQGHIDVDPLYHINKTAELLVCT